MPLNVDSEKCIGCGLCTTVAANTFKMTDDGKSAVIDPKGDSDEIIKQAIDSCPVQAISLE